MRSTLRSAILATVVGIAPFASAQTAPTFAVVSGTVIDTTGATIPGAKVQLIHPGRLALESRTDNQGAFEIPVEPGEYTLETLAPGFARYQTFLPVSATNPPTVRIKLEIANGGCGVCVSVQPPIETLDASLTSTIPLPPMPPYKQPSRKWRAIAR